MQAIEQLDVTWRSALLFSLFMPLVFIQITLFGRKTESLANRFLAVFLFVYSLNLVPQIIGFSGAYQVWPNLTFAPFSIELLLGPLLLAHIHFLTSDAPFGRHWFWFVPGGIQFIYYTGAFLGFDDYRDKWAFNDAFHEPLIMPIQTVLAIGVTIACLVLCWQRIKHYQQSLEDNHSNIAEFEPVWLEGFLRTIAILAFIWLGFEVADRVFDFSYIAQYPVYILLTLIMVRFGFHAVSRVTVEYPKFAPPLLLEDISEDQTSEELNWQQLGKSYADTMRREKWYLESKLSLPQLSARLATNDNYLSKAINQGLGKNFNRLINEVRIEHAQDLMLKNQETTLLAIAYDSGFSSKASFNRAFREIVGLTPTQFRAQKM